MILLFFCILLIIGLLRKFLNLEYRWPDVVVACIPVVVWLLVSGGISSVEIGKFKMETPISKASKKTIETEVNKMAQASVKEEAPESMAYPTDAVSQSDALEPVELPAPDVEVIMLVTGREYTGEGLSNRVRMLVGNTRVKYVIVSTKERTFIGLVRTKDLLQAIDSEQLDPEALAQWLKEDDRVSLDSIPQWIPRAAALSIETEKREALEKMSKLDATLLPVLDEDEGFNGVITRDKITASILKETAEHEEMRAETQMQQVAPPMP